MDFVNVLTDILCKSVPLGAFSMAIQLPESSTPKIDRHLRMILDEKDRPDVCRPLKINTWKAIISALRATSNVFLARPLPWRQFLSQWLQLRCWQLNMLWAPWRQGPVATTRTRSFCLGWGGGRRCLQVQNRCEANIFSDIGAGFCAITRLLAVGIEWFQVKSRFRCSHSWLPEPQNRYW